MCQALVQSLAEIAPTYTYRINPDPRPEQAFVLSLDLSDPGYARLRWQGDGAGTQVHMTDAAEPDLAAQLVAASPELVQALRASFHASHE